jgi:protein-tyrosine phosphatase
MATWSWRRLLRGFRRIRDRRAHDARRLAARRRLAAAPPAASMLMVCTANLCRSPYAAAAMRREMDARSNPIRVESAGYLTPNRTPPADALAAAAARGVDLSTHRSRSISPALLDAAELIVVMEAHQAQAVMARRPAAEGRVIVLGDLDPEPISAREIVDPYGEGRAAFDACYERIDRCVGALARALAETTARPSGAASPGSSST